MTETFGGRGSFWCPLCQSDLTSWWSKFLSFNSFHPVLTEVRHALCWARAGHWGIGMEQRFLLF